MFSYNQKRYIAHKIEELLLGMGHPELPDKNINFKLHIDGTESWQYADIVSNHNVSDEDAFKSGNPWNEKIAETMKR